MGEHIDASAAVDIAKSAAEEAGHGWLEPVSVKRDGRQYVVSTNAQELGGNVVVAIDAVSGQVLKLRFYAR